MKTNNSSKIAIWQKYMIAAESDPNGSTLKFMRDPYEAPSEFKKVFIHRDPVDMRKYINGLSEIVEQFGIGSLMEPHLFVFSGRRKNVVKSLYFLNNTFLCAIKRCYLILKTHLQ